jgi:hypothetical protein
MMPHIRVIEGVMYEFDNSRNKIAPLAELGLNAYRYLEARDWSATGTGSTNPNTNPDYTDDFPFLYGHGFRFLSLMGAPFGMDLWENGGWHPDRQSGQPEYPADVCAGGGEHS